MAISANVFDILHKLLFHPLSLPLLLLTIFIYKILFKNRDITKNPPPCPPKLPILGNLHQLGKFPHRSLQTLSNRYGENGFMSMQIGSSPALVISSSDAAREIMKTHDIVFANRANSRTLCKIVYGCRDLVFSPYSDFWKQIRSISVIQLFSNKKVQSFRNVREEEVFLAVDTIKRSILSPVNLSEILLTLSNDVLCRVAFGRKYGGESNGINFKNLLAELGEVLAVFSFGDFIPWLGWIDRVSGLERRVDNVAKDFDCFLENVVQEHVDRFKDDNKDENKDFVDILLGVQKENPNALPNDSIKAIILDMFVAGTDTTYTLLEWTMTELLGHPRVMKQLQDEVREAVTPKPMVDEDDLQKLNYLKAVIKETLRLHPPLPILLIRESSKDVKIHGYDIAAKTQVLINAWAVQRDPSYWEDPDMFKPERFLKSSVDVKGTTVDFNLIPFGGGRRGCPGISFAFASAELTLANLVYNFDWKLPDGAECNPSNVPEHPGLIVNRRDPLIAFAIRK
ncbi:cytochrome P450 736A117-like [Silene latifolia]|uniref:cytochrome P450 736A117-like n=1 Tax=Silene latifolia TaxID=37657 RepID=UPI003D7722A8